MRNRLKIFGKHTNRSICMKSNHRSDPCWEKCQLDFSISYTCVLGSSLRYRVATFLQVCLKRAARAIFTDYGKKGKMRRTFFAENLPPCIFWPVSWPLLMRTSIWYFLLNCLQLIKERSQSYYYIVLSNLKIRIFFWKEIYSARLFIYLRNSVAQPIDTHNTIWLLLLCTGIINKKAVSRARAT
jgi:hypothetical protein